MCIFKIKNLNPKHTLLTKNGRFNHSDVFMLGLIPSFSSQRDLISHHLWKCIIADKSAAPLFQPIRLHNLCSNPIRNCAADKFSILSVITHFSRRCDMGINPQSQFSAYRGISPYTSKGLIPKVNIWVKGSYYIDLTLYPEGSILMLKKQDIGINPHVAHNGSRDQSLAGIRGPQVTLTFLIK